MVGILVSFWDGLFSGAFAVSFREGGEFPFPKIFPSLIHILVPHHVRNFEALSLYGGHTYLDRDGFPVGIEVKKMSALEMGRDALCIFSN